MMSSAEIIQRIYAIISAVLAEDSDGLDALMRDLDRDELDFLVTGFASQLAGHLIALAGRGERDDPRAAALSLVREFAVKAAAEPDL